MALDVSLSWLRAASDSAWRIAATRAWELVADSVILVGEAVRTGPPPGRPGDSASRILEAAEMARIAGRPLLFLSDGESDLTMEALDAALPVGSEVEVHWPARGPDAGIAGLDVPPAALAGDTMSAGVTVVAAEQPPLAVELTVSVDGRVVARQSLPALAAWERRREQIAFTLPAGPEAAHVTVALLAPDDVETRNDTAGRTIRRGQRMQAVAISSAPDFDFRAILGVLRTTLSLPVSARFRITADRWADDAGQPIAEARVRAEMESAPLVLLHGDTAYFGPPRAVARGALALLPPPLDDTEWYVNAAPPSPLSSLLAALPFDELPPVALGQDPAEARPLLLARGPGDRSRVAAAGVEGERRVVIAPLRGTSRWQLRGGAAGEGFRTLWGSLFEWLADRPGADFTVAPAALPPRELLPQRPTLTTGSPGTRPLPGQPRRLRSHGWVYLLLAVLLAAEWALRRRTGLR